MSQTNNKKASESGIDFYAFDNKSFTKLVAKSELVTFLNTELGSYGDDPAAISKCINYVLDEKRGGQIFMAMENDKLVGAAITNKTGMSGYIPGNILVYIAVSEKTRGKGVGKNMMKNIINATTGDICLHVDADNPAKRLYERLGFAPKYVEMRYSGEKK